MGIGKKAKDISKMANVNNLCFIKFLKIQGKFTWAFWADNISATEALSKKFF